jgi:integrase
MAVWISAGRGVRYQEHPTRKHGQRLDRYWCVRYKLNGRDVNEAVGWWSQGVTKAQCDGILAELRQNHRLGKGPQTFREMKESQAGQEIVEVSSEDEQGLTLSGMWPDYFDWLRASCSPRTVETFGIFKKTWLKPLGDMVFENIKAADLEELIVSPMLAAGKSASTIDVALTTFSSMWGWARGQGIVDGENPKYKAKRPHKDNRRVRFLSRDEAVRLLDDLKQRDMNTHDFALLSLFCGLRLRECLRLTWADINFESAVIFIKDSKNTFNRHAYITTELDEMLRRRGAGKPRHEKVFAGDKGGETGVLMRAHFREAVKELGFNDGITDRRQMFVFHSLRHTFASWLVQKGQPLYTVSKLLGHRSIRQTERYAHLAPATQRAAVQGLTL